MLQTEPTEIEGLLVVEPRVFFDDRGWFFESFNEGEFASATGAAVRFVQDNHSASRRGVLRGLHYQVPPNSQGKLVRCVSGALFDVAVDIRASSDTFGQWFGLELSAENRKQLWIPEGFAHGFLSLTAEAELVYKTTAYYSPSSDRSIRWDDPKIGIEWPHVLDAPILTDKDATAPVLDEADVFA